MLKFTSFASRIHETNSTRFMRLLFVFSECTTTVCYFRIDSWRGIIFNANRRINTIQVEFVGCLTTYHVAS